jgi:SRSO17 transposase
VDIADLVAVRTNLDRFLRRFDDCIKTEPTRGHLRTYVRGQLSNLERKSVEPIALEAGVPPRTLQEFLGLHRWDHLKMRDRVREIVLRDHFAPKAVAIIDETSFPKKGDQTAGVQRQYCGATGKTDNCVVTVDLAFATQDFHTLLDCDLYLPEETWHEDRERCRKAGIPDAVVYRPKWQIALELLDRALLHEVPFRYLVADEGYGRFASFRQAVAAKGLTCVVEVPRDTYGWTRPPRTEVPTDTACGRPHERLRLAAGQPPPRRVDQLWRRGGPSWAIYHIKDTEKLPVVWEVRTTRFIVAKDGVPNGEDLLLLVARNTLDGEVKYFLANAPVSMPLENLLTVAFSRWRIERSFEDAKGEIGFDHFEVRKYLPLMRHQVLSLVSMLFLMRETKRLRGEKSVVECSPGEEGCGGTTGSAAVPA